MISKQSKQDVKLVEPLTEKDNKNPDNHQKQDDSTPSSPVNKGFIAWVDQYAVSFK